MIPKTFWLGCVLMYFTGCATTLQQTAPAQPAPVKETDRHNSSTYTVWQDTIAIKPPGLPSAFTVDGKEVTVRFVDIVVFDGNSGSCLPRTPDAKRRFNFFNGHAADDLWVLEAPTGVGVGFTIRINGDPEITWNEPTATVERNNRPVAVRRFKSRIMGTGFHFVADGSDISCSEFFEPLATRQ